LKRGHIPADGARAERAGTERVSSEAAESASRVRADNAVHSEMPVSLEA
jgi:hypothetical protein